MTAVATALAYWVTRPGMGELRETRVAAAPGQVLLAAEYGAVSPGTERLVGTGRVPRSCRERMVCAYMEGTFDLPVKYGYGLVGRVLDGAGRGRRAFVMHPHQTVAAVREPDLVDLPEGMPARRAAVFPNLETAWNAFYDAELAGDERCVVVGGGAVGLLVAWMVWRERGAGPAVVERDAARRATARRLPWIGEVMAPRETPRGAYAVAFHASGTPAGLRLALDAVGFEGRVVELSWYGDRRVRLDLGGAFHFDRKRILSSQVSHVAGPKRGTYDRRRRRAEVMDLLGRAPELEQLLSDAVPFEELPATMREIYRGAPGPAPIPLVRHPGAHPEETDRCTSSPSRITS